MWLARFGRVDFLSAGNDLAICFFSRKTSDAIRHLKRFARRATVWRNVSALIWQGDAAAPPRRSNGAPST
jgi:hypothetical protein